MNKNFSFKNIRIFLFLLDSTFSFGDESYNYQQGQQQGGVIQPPYAYDYQQGSVPQQQPINVIINNSANANNSPTNTNNNNNNNNNANNQNGSKYNNKNKKDRNSIEGKEDTISFEERLDSLPIYTFYGNSFHKINNDMAYKLFPEDNRTVYNKVVEKKVHAKEEVDKYSNNRRSNRGNYNQYSRQGRLLNNERIKTNYKETEEVETKLVPTTYDLNLKKRLVLKRNIEKLEQNIDNLEKWNPTILSKYNYQINMAKKNGHLPEFSFYLLIAVDLIGLFGGFVISNMEKELINAKRYSYTNKPFLGRSLALSFLNLFSGLVTNFAYPNRSFYTSSSSQVIFFIINLLPGLAFLIENPVEDMTVNLNGTLVKTNADYKEKDMVLVGFFVVHLIISFVIFSSLKSLPENHNELVNKMNRLGFILGGKDEKTGKLMKGIFIPIEKTKAFCFEDF